MKKFVSILILLTVAIGGALLARGLAMNVHTIGKSYAVVDEVVDAPEEWDPKTPHKHYQKKYKIYEEYSPRIFWLKTTRIDTISTEIVQKKQFWTAP